MIRKQLTLFFDGDTLFSICVGKHDPTTGESTGQVFEGHRQQNYKLPLDYEPIGVMAIGIMETANKAANEAMRKKYG